MGTTPVLLLPFTQVNTVDPPPDDELSSWQFGGEVAALPDGGYMVVWNDGSEVYNPSGLVVGQRYDSLGNRVGGEVPFYGFVPLGLSGLAFIPSIAAFQNGDVVVG